MRKAECGRCDAARVVAEDARLQRLCLAGRLRSAGPPWAAYSARHSWRVLERDCASAVEPQSIASAGTAPRPNHTADCVSLGRPVLVPRPNHSAATRLVVRGTVLKHGPNKEWTVNGPHLMHRVVAAFGLNGILVTPVSEPWRLQLRSPFFSRFRRVYPGGATTSELQHAN